MFTTWQYIVSQLFVVLGMSCLGATYLVKNKRTILILSIISAFGYAMQYVFLQAYAGLVVNLVGIIRCIWFFLDNKHPEKKDYFSVSIIIALIVGLGIITFDGWASILPIVGAVLFTYSLWQDNLKVYRYIALVCSAIWITYNTIYMSIMAIVAECILIVVEIIGVIKLYTKNKSDISIENNLEDKKNEQN